MDHEKLSGRIEEERADPLVASRAEGDAADPDESPEPTRRVVDAGTSDELVIMDYSEELMQWAAREAERTPAPPRAVTPSRATEPRPAAGDADAEAGAVAAAPPSPADPHAERRERLGDVLGRDWEKELAHRDRPSVPRPAPTGVPAAAPRNPRKARTPAARAARPSPLPPGADRLVIGAAVVFVLASVLMGLRVEPFATAYYLFAWYPFLAVVNHATALRSPQHSILAGRLDAFLRLAAWSIPVWLTFELWNLRLGDWYYVGVPDRWFLRWPAIAASFATVLPGLFLLEEAQRVRGVGRSRTTPSFAVTREVERTLWITGAACGVVVLAMPRFFFPLVWGVPVLLIEPWLHRHDESSLLARVAAGRPGLVLRLLGAGAICGLFWEAANFFAVGKWIYTVPGFESGKLFEMPLLGFVGFPPFALCCWSMARALVAAGLLRDWQIRDAAGDVDPADATDPADAGLLPAGRRRWIRGGAVALSVLAMLGLDHWTVDSSTPRLRDIPDMPDGVAEYAAQHGRTDLRGLLRLIDDGTLYVPGATSAAAVSLLAERCRLIQLRGIGTANARRMDRVGIRTIDELAAADPADLTERLAATAESGWKPHPRRVRVWVAAARAARPVIRGG